ncbi:MAG: ribonuclease R [Campylobacteraceae bacterium]|nr:ribonuclease R [Campylobacteraceae bacterium]
MGNAKSLLLSLIEGLDADKIDKAHATLLNELTRKNIIKQRKNVYKFDSDYRAGRLDIALNGTGYLETFGYENKKDLIIESKHLGGGAKGDIVIVKRLFSEEGRAKAKVVFIVQKGFSTYVGVCKNINGTAIVQNIKTDAVIAVAASQKSLKQLPQDTLLKIDSAAGVIKEVLGVLGDVTVDEKISLSLYNKEELFSAEAENEAKSHGSVVDKSFYPNRLDLTHLPFCTIDPNNAKDFDDAIYFDGKNYTVYIAIADVSEYVYPFGFIDKEAKSRGFSIYFPHKSIPMLPRFLSENICSLKPNEDRLVFGFKIVLDKITLEPKNEELFEGIIHSKKRYTYEFVDRFISGKSKAEECTDKEILSWLLPLFELTSKLKAKRLTHAFNFHSDEIRINLDEAQNIISTTVEEETPSHALIEDCMLLANKAAAKRIKQGIFRTHEPPSFEKIEKLLDDLSLIGIEAKFNPDIPALIRDIQAQANEIGLLAEVDKLIIKSQKQARYTPENKGHFGLGFAAYSHFTSPIRRYSDLILHRLLKAQIKNEVKTAKFQLENIVNECENLSELEREADKVAWDFADRKFARYAAQNIGKCFICKVTELGKIKVATLDDELKGARIFLIDDNVELFEKVSVQIVRSDIASARITGKIIKRLD